LTWLTKPDPKKIQRVNPKNYTFNFFSKHFDFLKLFFPKQHYFRIYIDPQTLDRLTNLINLAGSNSYVQTNLLPESTLQGSGAHLSNISISKI
jgi:hypothetical protein